MQTILLVCKLSHVHLLVTFWTTPIEQSETNSPSHFERHARKEYDTNDFEPRANPLSMNNDGNIQFELPKVPVIFVLGGPGSGKVTHCDNLMQEKKGVTHINMTDLLQQYAVGNDMQDYSQLPSKTVTEVLMLEIKMAPTAKVYLISGYPRNMRDVVEYSENIQLVSGVILVSWRQKVLERQIDYGAKLGQIVLSLSKMELNNFFKNVIPVAEYFDQNGMLITINGERHPGDVYAEFRTSIMKILGMHDNPPALDQQDRKVPVNKVADNSEYLTPTEIVQQQQFRSYPNNVNNNDVITVRAHKTPSSSSPVKPGWPPVIWIIGGPGSNKNKLIRNVMERFPGWGHFSVGKALRDIADQVNTRTTGELLDVKENISNGELVAHNIVMEVVEANMAANIVTAGVIIDGFPRNVKQAQEFERKYKQKPTLILLDCSKLQLGRGRLDDGVSAFRRRLEIFREVSLPLLKQMDENGRLLIVDGDTDSTEVKVYFEKIIAQAVEELDVPTKPIPPQIRAKEREQQHRRNSTFIEDLEAVSGVNSISNVMEKRYANPGFANPPNGLGGALANGYRDIPRNAVNLKQLTRGVGKNQIADMYTAMNGVGDKNIRTFQVNHM